MESGGGFRVKGRGRFRAMSGMNVRLDSGSQLVIELPASWVLHYVLISAFFVAIILTLPFVGLILKSSVGNCSDGVDSGVGSELTSSFELVEALIEDLSREGLVTEVDKALIVGAGSSMGDVGEGLWFRSGNELHLAEESHLTDQSLIPDETYDFALVSSPLDANSVDRVMKVGGIVAARLMTDNWNEFLEKSNYKVVYLRNLEPAVLAARKIRPLNLNKRVVSPATRRLCEAMPEAKEAASRGSADSSLEPPRQALVTSREYFSNSFHEGFPARIPPFGNREIASSLNLPPWQMGNAEEEPGEDLLKNRVIHSADELIVECYRQRDVIENENSGEGTFWECMPIA